MLTASGERRARAALLRSVESLLQTLVAACMLCIALAVRMAASFDTPNSLVLESLWGFLDVFGICAVGGYSSTWGYYCLSWSGSLSLSLCCP
jgi:hypothetical protein|eukprot:6102079-Prymnesium_polylepis.1